MILLIGTHFFLFNIQIDPNEHYVVTYLQNILINLAQKVTFNNTDFSSLSEENEYKYRSSPLNDDMYKKPITVDQYCIIGASQSNKSSRFVRLELREEDCDLINGCYEGDEINIDTTIDDDCETYLPDAIFPSKDNFSDKRVFTGDKIVNIQNTCIGNEIVGDENLCTGGTNENDTKEDTDINNKYDDTYFRKEMTSKASISTNEFIDEQNADSGKEDFKEEKTTVFSIINNIIIKIEIINNEHICTGNELINDESTHIQNIVFDEDTNIKNEIIHVKNASYKDLYDEIEIAVINIVIYGIHAYLNNRSNVQQSQTPDSGNDEYISDCDKKKRSSFHEINFKKRKNIRKKKFIFQNCITQLIFRIPLGKELNGRKITSFVSTLSHSLISIRLSTYTFI
jgi:hypothetical protein